MPDLAVVRIGQHRNVTNGIAIDPDTTFRSDWSLDFCSVADVRVPLAVATKKFHIVDKSFDRMQPCRNPNNFPLEKGWNSKAFRIEFDLLTLIAAHRKDKLACILALSVALIFS